MFLLYLDKTTKICYIYTSINQGIMKIFGLSALAVVMLFVGVGMFFTIIQPQQQEKKAEVVPEVVIGTSSRINFTN